MQNVKTIWVCVTDIASLNWLYNIFFLGMIIGTL